MTRAGPAGGTGWVPDRTSWTDAAPFVAVGLLGLAVLPFTWAEPGAMAWVLGLAVAAALLVIAISLRRPRRTWLAPLGPMLYLLVIALARDVGNETAANAVSGLTILPILWAALMGTRTELLVTGALGILVFWVPAALVGEPTYPVGDYWRGVVVGAVAFVVAPSIQTLVQRLGEQRQVVARSEARWRGLLDHLPDLVVAVLEDDGRLRAIGGDVALRERYLAVVQPRHLDRVNELIVAARSARVGEEAVGDIDDAESGLILEVVATALSGADGWDVMLMLRNVSIGRRRHHELTLQAEHDEVTGLPNRRRLDAAMHRLIDDASGSPSDRGALLLVDLDRFKQVNDTYGHETGDRVLAGVARVLARDLRDTDVVARIGGDEFAVLLPDADASAAGAVAERIVTGIREHAVSVGGALARVTASVGVSTFAAAQQRRADVMTLADEAMYDAKHAGRGTHVVVGAGAPARRHEWRDRLRRAIQGDGFVLHLQPIVALDTEELVAAEALVRLRDGDRLLSPQRFWDLAESVGLANQIDLWVARRAVGLLAELRRDHPDLLLHVNISAGSIGSPDLEEQILRALFEHQVDGSALVIELTETTELVDVDEARAFAERMRGHGCHLALDDFGAGYSSLAYLRQLPVDFLKIDGEFVRTSAESSADRSIVNAVARLARDLGLVSVAEFVHDADTLAVVREAGVDLAQGHYFGAAMSQDEFASAFPGRRSPGRRSPGARSDAATALRQDGSS